MFAAVKAVKERSRKVFFGWWVVAGVMGIQMLISALFFQGFGVYVPILTEELGWSATAISAAIAFRQLLMSLIGPGVGYLLDRFKTRLIAGIGLVIFACGFMLFSRVYTIEMFVVVQLAIGLGASFAGFLPGTKILVNWFRRYRTTALALMNVGMSLGGLSAPLVAHFIVRYGWRSVALYSGVLALLGLMLTPLLRNDPKELQLEPDGRALPKSTHDKQPVTVADEPSFTLAQALQTPAFWFISFGHGLAITAVAAVVIHFVTHLNKGLGYNLQAAAYFFALMTVITIAGQLCGGFLGDRLNKRVVAMFAMLGHASALSILAISQSQGAVIAFCVLHGLSWGIRGPLMGALRADYFGRKAFGQIIGVSDIVVMAGALVGPLVAGYSFDRFGSYTNGFWMLAVLAGIGSLCFAFTRRPALPQTTPDITS